MPPGKERPNGAQREFGFRVPAVQPLEKKAAAPRTPKKAPPTDLFGFVSGLFDQDNTPKPPAAPTVQTEIKPVHKGRQRGFAFSVDDSQMRISPIPGFKEARPKKERKVKAPMPKKVKTGPTPFEMAAAFASYLRAQIMGDRTGITRIETTNGGVQIRDEGRHGAAISNIGEPGGRVARVYPPPAIKKPPMHGSAWSVFHMNFTKDGYPLSKAEKKRLGDLKGKKKPNGNAPPAGEPLEARLKRLHGKSYYDSLKPLPGEEVNYNGIKRMLDAMGEALGKKPVSR